VKTRSKKQTIKVTKLIIQQLIIVETSIISCA